ncbi:MAG: hypothetical protein ACRCR2_02625 [Fusobacteriaceae bacterium]
MSNAKLIIASQFTLDVKSLASYLLECVAEDWVDNNPTVMLPVNYERDSVADCIRSVIYMFNLVGIEYHALWQDYSGPCVIRHNFFGKYNSLAGQNRYINMANEATHAIIIWDGTDRDLEVLMTQMRHQGKKLKVILK